jgi:hypothetical protein
MTTNIQWLDSSDFKSIRNDALSTQDKIDKVNLYYSTWKGMGLSNAEISFALELINVESQFNYQANNGVPGNTIYGLGQWTNSTWTSVAVANYNLKYSGSGAFPVIDAVADRQNEQSQIFVMGNYAQNLWNTAISIQSSSLKDFSVFEIAYGLHHSHGGLAPNERVTDNLINGIYNYLTNNDKSGQMYFDVNRPQNAPQFWIKYHAYNKYYDYFVKKDVLDSIQKSSVNSIASNTATTFNAAAAAAAAPIPRRDPLVFDLDGDGIETVGVSNTSPIYFDYDGVASTPKTSTGWVKSDDAFLVRDVNGNGTIDSGRELFGDATLKRNGQLAVDGFDALADLDSNADGKISSADSAFASLRLWRDLNQDGVSQANELFTLASQNIATTRERQLVPLDTYTKCTSIRLPSALAYLRKVSMLGECLPEANALSSRATAGAFVPMRSATWACDKPAARLAASISSNIANSSRFKRSYSARTAGLSSIFAFNSACVNNDSAFMFNLLHSCFSNAPFTQRRFLRLFNKTMQHYNALAYQRAIKHTGHPLSTFKPQLKQAIAKRFGMRFTQVHPIRLHSISQRNKTRLQAFWQRQNICLQSTIVINNRVWHDANNNKYVTKKQMSTEAAANNDLWRLVA